jgi:hypothetical protein
MVRKSLKPVPEKIEGTFLDIEVPKFDWIKVDLTHNKINWINSKTDAIEKVEDNYNIVINLSQNMFNEDKELSSKIKEACRLNFAPYHWREKSYRFYTTDRTGSLDDKKTILNNLLSILQDYEISKKDQIDEATEIFKQDAKNKIKLESTDLLMKFHEPTERFVVLAKDFLGSEKFALLRKCSEYNSQLFSPESEFVSEENKFVITTNFFADDLPNKKLDKKTYFFINPAHYEEIKNHFILEEKLHQEFVEKQKRVSEENDLSEHNVEIDNVFGLKIKFNKENQCFEFYGKGYFENQDFDGRVAPRKLLGLWALNFIYSQEKQNDEDSYTTPYEMIVDKHKIELDQVKGGTKREKNIRIPASEWPKIKLIKENFEKEMQIWGREEKAIKITHCEFSSMGIFDKYPAVYFDSKGKCYLAFGCRRTGMFKAIGESFGDNFAPDILDTIYPSENTTTENGKKKRESKFSQTIKTIPISFEEATYFMEKHPFAEQIKRGSIDLNAVIHGKNDRYNLDVPEKLNTFNTVHMHAELYSQTEKNAHTKVKEKRMKL